MTQSSTSDIRAYDGAAITRWTDLLYAGHTPQQRACLDASWKMADDANAEIAVARRDPPDAPVVRGSAWCRLALSAYQRLIDAGAYADRTPAPECVADPGRIRAWLAGPSGVTNFESHTVADVWNFGAGFTDEVEHNLTNLIEKAQRAGVFGLPRHEITIWHLAASDQWVDGHLLTVDTPTGERYCSDFLAPTEVVAPDLHGTEAVVDTLTGLAATVDAILAPSRVRGEPAAPAPPAIARSGQPGQPAAARPFPHVEAVAPISPASLQPADRNGPSHTSRPRR